MISFAVFARSSLSVRPYSSTIAPPARPRIQPETSEKLSDFFDSQKKDWDKALLDRAAGGNKDVIDSDYDVMKMVSQTQQNQRSRKMTRLHRSILVNYKLNPNLSDQNNAEVLGDGSARNDITFKELLLPPN